MGIGKNFAAILIAGSVLLTTDGVLLAQAQRQPQAEEKEIEGQVQSIDTSGTQITLTDGTKLLTPPGAMLRPGALQEGMIVVATYREENGEKVLTGLGLKERGPATPGQSPPRRY